MAQVLTIDNRDYIPAGQVGKHFGYTRDYILALARDGKIDGKKIGHRWYVNLASAERFFASAKAEREERRQEIREERRSELRSHEIRRTKSLKSSRPVEMLAILVLGLVIGVAGYVGTGSSTQQAVVAEAETEISFFKRLAISLYEFISPQPVVTTDVLTYSVPTETTVPESAGTSDVLPAVASSTRMVHTSLVIGPDQVLTTTSIESIRESFSDDVSVSVDPHNPDTGIIVPKFKDREGEEYRYLIVPVREGNSP